MEWKKKVTFERVQAEGKPDFTLEIEELESLEDTIDSLFEELERKGTPALLEELCPYFGCVWPSARGLARYLLENSVEERGATRILEVGCGLALPSLMLAKTVRLSKVVATDFHPEVPGFLKSNLERNAVPMDRFEYRELDWRNPPPDLGRFGVVIGSDVLYEKAHPTDLADALVRLVKPQGRIIIADPGRSYLGVFAQEMEARGFFAEPLSIHVQGDGERELSGSIDQARNGTKEIRIYDFSKRG
jgi:predicted nicotinamide N-methyase